MKKIEADKNNSLFEKFNPNVEVIHSSNYYFEYKMCLFKNNLNGFDPNMEKPLIRFERNYDSKELNYRMFIVIPSWLEVKEDLDEDSLPFDTVNVYFDKSGIDTASLQERVRNREKDIQNEIDVVEKVITYKFKTNNDDSMADFEYKGYSDFDCKYTITVLGDSEVSDYSGTGVIVLTNSRIDSNSSAVYYFATNYINKKVIPYEILERNNKIEVEFKGDKDIPKFEINLYFAKNSIPCIKEDMSEVSKITFDINLQENTKYIYEPTNSGVKYYLGFKNQEDSKYYLLDCQKNETIPKVEENRNDNKLVYICPYCHRKIGGDNDISRNKAFWKKYHNASIDCSCTSLLKPQVIIKNEVKMGNAHHIMYCCKDLDSNSVLKRILPEKFMEHIFKKIVIIGSARSGKSTYISRFFNIIKDNKDKISMDAKGIVNSMNSLFYNKQVYVNPYVLKSVKYLNEEVLVDKNGRENKKSDRGKKVKKYYVTDRDQGLDGVNTFTSKYALKIGRGRVYPQPTDTGKDEMVNNPFFLEVNRKYYIGFYDLAGEDAENGNDIFSQLIRGDNCNNPLGIFCLVNGSLSSKNTTETRNLISKIKRAIREGNNCPIAIMLTKFDQLESKFDSNCFCIRDDYFNNKYKKYEGSYLEKYIDMSSEEIKSYLRNLGIDNELNGLPNKPNIKYFPVSSFASKDVIYHEILDNAKEINYLKYDSAIKKLELPFIWMLYQLGIIN